MVTVNGYDALTSEWYQSLAKQAPEFPVAKVKYDEYILTIIENDKAQNDAEGHRLERKFSLELSQNDGYGHFRGTLYPVFSNAITTSDDFKREIEQHCMATKKSYDETRSYPNNIEEQKIYDAKLKSNGELIKGVLTRMLLLNAKTIVEEAFKRKIRKEQLPFIIKQSTGDSSFDKAIIEFAVFYFSEQEVQNLNLDSINNKSARITRIQQIDGATICNQEGVSEEELEKLTPKQASEITNEYLFWRLPNKLKPHGNPKFYHVLSRTRDLTYFNTKVLVSRLVKGWKDYFDDCIAEAKATNYSNVTKEEEEQQRKGDILFEESQFKGRMQLLSPEQVKLLNDDVFLKYLDSSQLANLTAEQVQNIKDKELLQRLQKAVRHATLEQISQLKHEQYDFLETAQQIAKVNPEHYDHLARAIPLIPVGNDMSKINFVDFQTKHPHFKWLPTNEQVAAITQPAVIESIGKRIALFVSLDRKEAARVIWALRPEMVQYLPSNLLSVISEEIAFLERGGRIDERIAEVLKDRKDLYEALKAKLTVVSPPQPHQAANRQSVTSSQETVNRQPVAQTANPKADDKKPSLLKRIASTVWAAFCAIGAFFARLFARCFGRTK